LDLVLPTAIGSQILYEIFDSFHKKRHGKGPGVKLRYRAWRQASGTLLDRFEAY
jgi:hypothetical protein